MNQKLSELYQSLYPELTTELAPFKDVSKPLLCRVPDGYTDTTVRLMVVGQETRGWGVAGVQDVGSLMNFYREFDLAHSRPTARRSPIWQAAHQLFNGLNPQGPERAFIWSNLVKVDQNGSRPKATVEEIVSRFGLLPREIAITRPGAVVFFTGPYYRSRLTTTFPGVSLEPAAPKISRVVHPQLPKASFHTYHPGYLRRGHWHVIDALIALIRDDAKA